MHSKIIKLIILIAIMSLVAYSESTRTCNNDEQSYRTAIKVTCSNSQISKHIQRFTSISSNLVDYVNEIVGGNFKLKSQVDLTIAIAM